MRDPSAFRIDQVCEYHSRNDAVRHLQAGRVVILSAGTGNPFSPLIRRPACAIEIGADVLIKAPRWTVSTQPIRSQTCGTPNFIRYLSYDRVLREGLV